MTFIKKLAILLIRPLYRAFLERPLWWFLAKVKVFFFAEINAELAAIETKIDALDRRLSEQRQLVQLAAIEETFRAANESNAAQWDAIEQLLLALFRQSHAPVASDSHLLPSPAQHLPVERVHAASNLR